MGLGLIDDTSDETTLVTFRKRLRQARKIEDLFTAAAAYSSASGPVLQDGTLAEPERYQFARRARNGA